MDSYNKAELAQTLFEEAGDALFLIDPDTEHILDVNPMAQRLCGFTRRELLHMQASYLFRSEDQGGLARLRHAFKKTESFHSQEGFLLRNRNDGMWIPLNLTLARLHVQPKTLGLITVRDIHEQRETFTKLRKTEERLRTVVTNAPVILFALNRNGVFTLLEGKGLDAQGIKPGDLLGHSVFEVYSKVPEALRNVHRVLAGESFMAVVAVTQGPGAGRSFETHYSPLKDRHDHVIGAIGIATDITERKRAEDEVKKISAFLDSIVENIPIMLFVKDAEHLRYERQNRASRAILGFSEAEMLGKSDYDFFPREEADFFIAKDREVLRDKRMVDIPEEVILTKDGERILHTKKIPLLDDAGVPRHLVGIAEDITERKRAERRMRVQHAVTRVLAESATLDEATPRLIEALGTNIGCEAGAIWNVDRHSGVLYCIDVWHASDVHVDEFEALTRQTAFAPGLGLPGRIWLAGQPVWIPDILQDINFPRAPVAAKNGLQGALGFPILLGTEVLGVIEFFSREVRLPDADLLELFAAIGSQIGQFIKRKRAEEKLRHSEERFRLLVEGVKDYAIFLLDPQGQVVSWNAGAERIKGYRAEEIIGQQVARFYPIEEVQARKPECDLHKAATEGRHETEGWHVRKDDSQFWANIVFTALRDEVGQFKGYSVIVRDLTERKRTEEIERNLRVLEVESNIARQIQRKLFPVANPWLPGFDIGGMSYPMVATGGDYFDYIPHLDGGLGVVIGDAAGHGSGPALLMASTRAYLRSLTLTHWDVGKILTLTNRLLAADVGDRFVTLVLARFDPATRSFIYASAGHPPGYIISPSGQVKMLMESTGFPLGVVSDFEYTPAPRIILEPGEIVLFLTDGILEACAPDGPPFGINRALDVVRATCNQAAQDIVCALYAEVCKYCAGKSPLDDITMVVLKVNSAA